LVTHDVLHVVASHTYGAHDFGTSVHEPAPSHVAACVSTPEEHALVPHDVVLDAYVHFVESKPLQSAPQVVPAPVPEHPERAPCGAPTTAAQFPTLPATSHAAH
jgi:hypothetical protein